MASSYIYTPLSFIYVFIYTYPCGALDQISKKKKSERMAARIVVALACMVVMLGLSKAAVYKVGDSAGWTTIANVDYKLWASTKTFHIGDTVCEFHNILTTLIIH